MWGYFKDEKYLNRESLEEIEQKKEEPDYGRALNNIGVGYWNGENCQVKGFSQDHEKAIDYFERAVDEGNICGYTNMGIIYGTGYGRVKRNPEKAIEYRRKELELTNSIDHWNEAVISLLGWYEELNRKDEIEKLIDEYERRFRNNFDYTTVSAFATYFDKKDDLENAKKWYQIIISKADDDAPKDNACEELTWLILHLGTDNDVLEWLGKVERRNYSCGCYEDDLELRAGRIYYNQGEEEKALDHINKAANLRNDEACELMGDFFFNEECTCPWDYQEAIKWYNKAYTMTAHDKLAEIRRYAPDEYESRTDLHDRLLRYVPKMCDFFSEIFHKRPSRYSRWDSDRVNNVKLEFSDEIIKYTHHGLSADEIDRAVSAILDRLPPDIRRSVEETADALNNCDDDEERSRRDYDAPHPEGEFDEKDDRIWRNAKKIARLRASGSFNTVLFGRYDPDLNTITLYIKAIIKHGYGRLEDKLRSYFCHELFHAWHYAHIDPLFARALWTGQSVAYDIYDTKEHVGCVVEGLADFVTYLYLNEKLNCSDSANRLLRIWRRHNMDVYPYSAAEVILVAMMRDPHRYLANKIFHVSTENMADAYRYLDACRVVKDEMLLGHGRVIWY